MSTNNNNNNNHESLENNQLYSNDIKFLKSQIKTYENFPKEGISFKDTFSLFRHSETLLKTIDVFTRYIAQLKPDVIVGLDARGFTFGAAVAYNLKSSFVPIRKHGKLPGPVKALKYVLEYREDVLEIQEDSIKPGERVVIVDDLVATGGTLAASIDLIESIGGHVIECVVMIELPNLGWENRVKRKITSVFSC